MSIHAPEHATAPVSWVPNRKVVTQFATNVLTGAVALLVTKLGLHESPAVALWISGGIGIAAGAVAAYVVREVPVVERDL